MQDPSFTFPALAGPVVELSPRRVRVRFGEVFVADSTHALLLRQYGPNRLPTYYFPPNDVLDSTRRRPHGRKRSLDAPCGLRRLGRLDGLFHLCLVADDGLV